MIVGEHDGSRTHIAYLPSTSGLNPYYQLFYGALRPYGIDLVEDAQYDLDWFRANRPRLDWVHRHWVGY